MAPAQRVPFLALLREVRDLVYDHCVPSYTIDLGLTLRHGVSMKAWRVFKDPGQRYVNQACSLMTANKQVASEFISVLFRKATLRVQFDERLGQEVQALYDHVLLGLPSEASIDPPLQSTLERRLDSAFNFEHVKLIADGTLGFTQYRRNDMHNPSPVQAAPWLQCMQCMQRMARFLELRASRGPLRLEFNLQYGAFGNSPHMVADEDVTWMRRRLLQALSNINCLPGKSVTVKVEHQSAPLTDLRPTSLEEIQQTVESMELWEAKRREERRQASLHVEPKHASKWETWNPKIEDRLKGACIPIWLPCFWCYCAFCYTYP